MGAGLNLIKLGGTSQNSDLATSHLVTTGLGPRILGLSSSTSPNLYFTSEILN